MGKKCCQTVRKKTENCYVKWAKIVKFVSIKQKNTEQIFFGKNFTDSMNAISNFKVCLHSQR